MSSLPPPPPTPVEAEVIGHVEGDARRWGLGEVWLGLIAANAAVLVAITIVLGVTDYDGTDDLPMWLFGLIGAPLHVTLAVVAVYAARQLGRGVVRDYRLRMRSADIGIGLVTGFLAQLVLVPAVTYPVLWLFDRDVEDVSEVARDLADRATTTSGVISLIITACLLAPVVEELFFRGLVFEAYKKRQNLPWLEGLPAPLAPDTTSRRWNLGVALVLSSALFAAVHGSLLLFPALFVVGILLALIVQRSGRLGLSIWTHIGFNATTVVALLAFDDDAAALGIAGLVIG